MSIFKSSTNVQKQGRWELHAEKQALIYTLLTWNYTYQATYNPYRLLAQCSGYFKGKSSLKDKWAELILVFIVLVSLHISH